MAGLLTSHRNHGCRLRDFLWRGHRCITLENETLRVLVAASKGADLLEFLHKPTDTECLWSAPAGLQPLHFRPSSPLDGGHFREYFAGGWYEMLPNGPTPCRHRGAAFGHHGEATLLPWEVRVVADDPAHVAVEFCARLNRTPLFVCKRMDLRAGSGTLTITEEITNEAPQPVEILWGQHPTFGAPLLAPGARIFVPPCDVVVPETTAPDGRLAPAQRSRWPYVHGCDGAPIDLSVLPPLSARSHDFVRLENLAAGWFAVVNPFRRCGFALRYDTQLFPVLGFWQLFHGAPDYPWYGRHYLAALEPACDLPSLAEAAARGTAIPVAPHASIATTWEATVFSGSTEVRSVEPKGIVL